MTKPFTTPSSPRLRDQRIGERPARASAHRIRGLARNGDLEQRIGDRVGREHREAVEQAAALGKRVLDRRRPGRGEAHIVVVAHQGRVEPFRKLSRFSRHNTR